MVNKNRLSFVFAPAVAVVWNLLLAFIVYQIARYAYYLENTDYLNPQPLVAKVQSSMNTLENVSR